MESLSTEFYTMESTSNRIDISDIMELLDESSYLEEDNDEGDKLLRLIQSLEAEIDSEFGLMDVDLLLDDLPDLDSCIGSGSIGCPTDPDNYSFQWMELEPEAGESDMASWYLEDELEYGETRGYPYFCYNEEESIEQEEYYSLWE